MSHDTPARTRGAAPAPVALAAHLPESGVAPNEPVEGPVLLLDNARIPLLECPKRVMLCGDGMVSPCPIAKRMSW